MRQKKYVSHRQLFSALVFIYPLIATTGSVSAAQEAACTGPRDNQVRVRMINGHKADHRDWPGQVALLRNLAGHERGLSTQFCGGTIIAPQWVLTAAHCIEDYCDGLNCPVSPNGSFTNFREYGDLYDLQVALGTDDLKTISADNTRRVSKIIMRDGYKSAEQSGNDIALLRLDRPWTSGPYSRLSLSSKTDPSTDSGERVMVAGFGLKDVEKGLNEFTRADGTPLAAGSPYLEEVLVPIVEENICKTRYSNYFIGNGQICAGYEEGRFDACRGDSGGQMVAFDKDGCPYQIGIVSWGEGCAQPKNYGVYTKVSYHEKWIRHYVGQLANVDEASVLAPNLTEVKRSLATSTVTDLQSLLEGANDKVKLTIPGGTRIKLGQIYKFSIESEVSGRLILIDINAKGVVTQLFPNDYLKSPDAELIRKGKMISVPGDGYGFSGFQAVPPLGKGQVVAIVVPEDFTRVMIAPEKRASRGFVPVSPLAAEPAPLNYLANLVDEISQLTRTVDETPANLAISVTDYEIVE